jgi:hypothetical protein
MEQLNTPLFTSVKEIILEARQRIFRMVNSNLLETYWKIGQLIVEDEQEGKPRADYGKNDLKNLAQQLTVEFGKGFDYTNLTNMRKFYQSFPILDTLRQELSWSHYRQLCRLDSERKIQYYLTEPLFVQRRRAKTVGR